MSTPVAPDNGVKLRGSVASRKATLRVHTLYDNEGKVSISTKSFRTLLVKIRGDPTQLGRTLTVELFEASKKGRSGLPLHTLRIKHCTALERSMVKKYECITFTSDRAGAVVFREMPDCDDMYEFLEQAYADGSPTVPAAAPSFGTVSESETDEHPTPPKGAGGVRGAALRATAAAKAQRQASPPANGVPAKKGFRRKPSVYEGFSDGPARRPSAAPAGFEEEPADAQRSPSIPQGFGNAKFRRKASTYGGFGGGDSVRGKGAAPLVPDGFGEAPPPTRKLSTYGGFEEQSEVPAFGRRGTVYDGFDEGGHPQQGGHQNLSAGSGGEKRSTIPPQSSSSEGSFTPRPGPKRSGTVTSVYDGFDEAEEDDVTARSGSISSRTGSIVGFADVHGELGVDPTSRPPIAAAPRQSTHAAASRPRRRASATTGLEATIDEVEEVATPPPKSPQMATRGHQRVDGSGGSAPPTQDVRVMTLPKKAALSHRQSLLAESDELAQVAARLEREIAEMTSAKAETIDGAAAPARIETPPPQEATPEEAVESATAVRHRDSTTSALAFLLDQDDDAVDVSEPDVPVDVATPPSNPPAGAVQDTFNPFAAPEECSDCGELKLDGWIDIAVDDAWYCKMCWEAFAEDDEDVTPLAEAASPTQRSVPLITVADDDFATPDAAPSPPPTDPRIGPVPVTFLGQSVGLEATSQAARKAIMDSATSAAPRVASKVAIDSEAIRVVDAGTGAALAIIATEDVKATFLANSKAVVVFSSDGRGGVSQCFSFELSTQRAADGVSQAFSEIIKRSEKLAIKGSLMEKRGRSGSVAFAKRASVRHSVKPTSRGGKPVTPRATLGQGLNRDAADVMKRKQFSFRRRSVEAVDNRKSFAEGALGTGQEDRAVPIALYKCKYLGAHIVDPKNGGKQKAGSQMVIDAVGQAASLVKDGSAEHDVTDVAIVVSLGGIHAMDMLTSEELLTVLPFSVQFFHVATEKKVMKKLKPCNITGFDSMCMGIIHTKPGTADQSAMTVELFCLGKDVSAGDIGDIVQRVVRLDVERLQTRSLSAFDPSDPNEEESTEPLAPSLTEIPREELTCLKMLGKGEYGEVFLGLWEPHKLHVAAKLAKKKLSIQDASNFLGEAEIMAPLRHNNIVNLLGVQIRRRPWLIILEFAQYGALVDLLKTMRSRQPPLAMSSVEQMYVGYQVSSALHYLGSCHRLVHMDLATRNCLVSAGSHIKVADFGVAQIMDDGRDWWKQTYKMRLPGRWLAPECVRKQRYSAASDVWAFGILLWEMTSGGKQPYPFVKLPDVTKYVRDGGRCPRLEGTDDRLWDMMGRCWQNEFVDRPTFGILCRELGPIGQRVAAEGHVPLRDIGLLSSHGPSTPQIEWVDLDGELEL